MPTKTAPKPATPSLIPHEGIKFTCAQSDLNAHLSLVSKAVPSRPSRPVLGNVLMRVKGNTVTLIGFDEAMGIQTTFPAQVEGEGDITLPAKLLGDIVSRLPHGDITLTQVEGEDAIDLTCSTGSYQVRGLSAEDYPALPEIEGESIELQAEVLLRGIRAVLIAISTDETKLMLTGGHILGEGKTLEFQATDGHRLSIAQADNDAQSIPTEVTIPGKALRELDRMLAAYGGDTVAVRMDDTQAEFTLGGQRITTRLLEGQYPKCRQLVPKQFVREMVCDRRQLIAALERIGVLASLKNDIVKLSLSAAGQTLAVSAEAQEQGKGQETLKVNYTGEDIDIAFNGQYLTDGLKSFASQDVVLKMNSPTSPAVLTPQDDQGRTYLVMPVSIKN